MKLSNLRQGVALIVLLVASSTWGGCSLVKTYNLMTKPEYDRGFKQGKVQGFDQGYQRGQEDGHSAGYNEGLVEGQQLGHQSGQLQGRADNFIFYASAGAVSGFVSALILLLYLTKRWWIADVLYMTTRYRVVRLFGHYPLLDPELKLKVQELSHKIRQICHFIETDRRLSNSKYCRELCRQLRSQKYEMIKPAILAQELKRSMAKIDSQPEAVQALLTTSELDLERASERAKPEIKDNVGALNECHQALVQSQETIDQYERLLDTYIAKLTTLYTRVNLWKFKDDQKDIKIEDIKDEVFIPINVINGMMVQD